MIARSPNLSGKLPGPVPVPVPLNRQTAWDDRLRAGPLRESRSAPGFRWDGWGPGPEIIPRPLVEKINQTLSGKFQSTPQLPFASREPFNQTLPRKFQADSVAKFLQGIFQKLFYRPLAQKIFNQSSGRKISNKSHEFTLLKPPFFQSSPYLPSGHV